MSLVHEALQKAEREKQRKTGVGPPPPPAPPQPQTAAPVVPPVAPASSASTEPSRSHPALLTTLVVCVGVVALVAIVYLVSNATSTIRESQQGAPVTTAAPAPPPPEPVRVQTAPVPEPPAPEPRYRITGITKNADGGYFAIINGQLRSENQYVDGATIKKIERDRVTIDVNGVEQVLRLF